MQFPVRNAACGMILAIAGVAFHAGQARAEIHAWYTLSSPSGWGTAVPSVVQGGPGLPLVMELKPGVGGVVCRVRLHVDIPVDEDILAYSTDLIAPDAHQISARSILYYINFDLTSVAGIGSAPGALIDDALQMNVSNSLSGRLVLYEVEFEIIPPASGEVRIFSAIGSEPWAGADPLPPIVRFADAEPIDGSRGQTGSSSTPSIIIRAYKPGIDCDANGISDGVEIRQNSALDCNRSGTLDACEVRSGAVTDCNYNGVPDACDIAAQTSADTDGNLVPDECEGVAPVYPDPTLEGFPKGTAGPGTPHLIDRSALADFLRKMLMLPGEGESPTPVVSRSMGLMGILADPTAGLQVLSELMSLPQRLIMYNALYTALDLILP